jgi:hypothetical protein
MNERHHLTRRDLAARWGTSIRTIDRLRGLGKIPWIDLSGGQGKRPIVRFKLSDILKYETAVTQSQTQSQNAYLTGRM